MTDHLSAVDPRGYKVVCSEEQWNGHVLFQHPEMKDTEQLVISAIEKPMLNTIYGDAQYENRNIYYHRHRDKPRYVKVIVAFDENNLGIIVTAFYADSGKSGEKPIWPE